MERSGSDGGATARMRGCRRAILTAERRVVAIVEDDPSVLRAIERLLSVHGFVTEAYPSAEAFLGRAAASGANCLVLDIQLRGVSGIELQRRLSAAGSRLPVIFMTAADTEITRSEAIAAGCIAYLRKPFPTCQLTEAIDKVVG
jgi:FixJ family two-component response regulator